MTEVHNQAEVPYIKHVYDASMRAMRQLYAAEIQTIPEERLDSMHTVFTMETIDFWGVRSGSVLHRLSSDAARKAVENAFTEQELQYILDNDLTTDQARLDVLYQRPLPESLIEHYRHKLSPAAMEQELQIENEIENARDF